MISQNCCDALVAGGGPAGSTLAIALAEAGRSVVLLEKSKEAQHKVCGEFLSPESLPFLQRIGIDPEELGAQKIDWVRLAARDVLAEVRLPAAALSLTRQTLDEALLQRAQRAGVSVMRGFRVEALSRSKEIWQARLVSGESQDVDWSGGRDAFLATGKHDVHGWARTAKRVQGELVAMKMYFALTPEQRAELAGHVELILYPGGYAGLQPVEGRRANLCALVTRQKLLSLGGRWERVLEHMQRCSEHLTRRLSGAKALLEHPLALSAIPYGYCTPVAFDEPSPWRVGDQAAVIPSFSGDGMAIAFYTAERAAQLYLEGSTAAIFHAEVRRELGQRLDFATMISRLVIAMPSLAQAVRLWPSALSGIFSATRVPGSGVGVFAR
jgi:flavin-dependent dehydrogenase